MLWNCLVEVLGSLVWLCKYCFSFKIPHNFSGCIFYNCSAGNDKSFNLCNSELRAEENSTLCFWNLISCKWRSKLTVVKNCGLKPPPPKLITFHYFGKWWMTKITNLVSGEKLLPESWNGEMNWGSYMTLDSSPVKNWINFTNQNVAFFPQRWASAKKSSDVLGEPVFSQILLVFWILQGMFYCVADFTESLQVFTKLVYLPVGDFFPSDLCCKYLDKTEVSNGSSSLMVEDMMEVS